jgi:hypothetical protein
MKQRLLTLFAAAAIATAFSFCGSTAKAQSPFLGPGFGNGCCGGGYLGSNFTGLYGLGKIPVPPYFSLHPPVYYSVPVPRPYGYSPYALWPGMEPVETIALPQAEEVLNPHVNEEIEAPEASATGHVAAAHQPQWILNPFVEQTVELATLPVVE